MEEKRILFADDDANVRVVVSSILELDFSDYRAEFFKNGFFLDERLEYNLNGVRVVITDNEMPGMCGLEIIQKYANDIRFKEKIPFILCYGGDEAVGQEAIRNGAFGYILKPYSISDFSDTLKRALG